MTVNDPSDRFRVHAGVSLYLSGREPSTHAVHHRIPVRGAVSFPHGELEQRVETATLLKRRCRMRGGHNSVPSSNLRAASAAGLATSGHCSGVGCRVLDPARSSGLLIPGSDSYVRTNLKPLLHNKSGVPITLCYVRGGLDFARWLWAITLAGCCVCRTEYVQTRWQHH